MRDVDFHAADLTEVRLNSTYDVVMMVDSFEHIPPFRQRELWHTLRLHSHEGTLLYVHIPTPQKKVVAQGRLRELGGHGGGTES